MTLYAVAGLATKIELPVPLIQNIIPLTDFYDPWQRPGYRLRTSRPRWIQHETDNPRIGANALMHKNWLFGGPVDRFERRVYVSFHFCVDDHEIRQFVPITEVTWQGGDNQGDGNFNSVSSELCINADGDEAAARHNAEALCAEVLKALGHGADAVGRHWDYNWVECCNGPCDVQCGDRHHCPDHMMSQGYWPTFVRNIATRINGGAPVPELNYPPHMDKGIAARMFGWVKGEDGRTYQFNENGGISRLWLAEFGPWGWPPIKEVWVYDGGARRYVRFDGGPTIFIGADRVPAIMKEAA